MDLNFGCTLELPGEYFLNTHAWTVPCLPSQIVNWPGIGPRLQEWEWDCFVFCFNLEVILNVQPLLENIWLEGISLRLGFMDVEENFSFGPGSGQIYSPLKEY